jgi:hypothetical protein
MMIAIAVMLLFTGAAGWTASGLAADRVHQLQNGSPAAEASFACDAWVLADSPPEPLHTLMISGASCGTVTRLEGYRQVASRVLPLSLSPVDSRTPEGIEIPGRVISAQYGPVIVIAASDRLDRAADKLVGLRVVDLVPLWQLNCRDALAVRFARVPGGDDPLRGHVSRGESAPAVVVACQGNTMSFDPLAGPK